MTIDDDDIRIWNTGERTNDAVNAGLEDQQGPYVLFAYQNTEEPSRKTKK
jgi:hypothetical protein